MQNTCPNAGCGAMYNLTAQHIGRSFACKKCGATLVVGANGLETVGETAANVAPIAFGGVSEEPPPVRRSPRFSGGGAGAAFGQFWDRVKTDASTWVFGAGAFFTILFLFIPLLDRARVARRQVKVDAGDRKEQRLNKELQLREAELRAKGEDVTKLQKEREQRDKDFKRWQEVEKPKLQEEVDEASDSEKTSRWWNFFGMMFGFLLLAFASLGYLTPDQPTIRRVVGSIVICAILLMIFLRFVFIEGLR